MERGANRYCNHWQFCSREIKFYQHNQRVSAYYIFLPFFLAYPWNGGELLETFIWCYSMGQKPNVSNETQFISVSYKHHHEIIFGGFALNLSFFKLQEGFLEPSLQELFFLVLHDILYDPVKCTGDDAGTFSFTLSCEPGSRNSPSSTAHNKVFSTVMRIFYTKPKNLKLSLVW